jgi:LPXTG-motif cell wall-anchored protein
MMMISLNMYLKRIFTLLSQYWWTTVMGVILIGFLGYLLWWRRRAKA